VREAATTARADMISARAVMVAEVGRPHLHSMLERHAWKLFVLIGALGLVMSIGMLVDPGIGISMLARVGPPLPSGAATDPFTAFTVRWTATALVGANAITIAVAATALRRGERWAGVAMVYWPAMFVSHLVLYAWGPMSLVQVMWIALTVPVLFAHLARKRRPTPEGSGGTVAAS
jgi:hypothetical protein